MADLLCGDPRQFIGNNPLGEISRVARGPSHRRRSAPCSVGHKQKAMKRILGYTDKLTVRPSGLIEFKVSAENGLPYRAQLVRLVNGDTQSGIAGFKELEISSPINGTYRARHQPIVTGSCIVIEKTQPLIGRDALTVALFLMPTRPNFGRQHLVSHVDQDTTAGWSLHLGPQGQLSFATTDELGRTSTVENGYALRERTWYFVAVRISWVSRSISLDCVDLGAPRVSIPGTKTTETAEVIGNTPVVSSPLLIAARYGGRTSSGTCIPLESFNGRLEAPVIYRRTLTAMELQAVMSGERPPSLKEHLVGDWD